jgi:hypothetical protein
LFIPIRVREPVSHDSAEVVITRYSFTFRKSGLIFSFDMQAVLCNPVVALYTRRTFVIAALRRGNPLSHENKKRGCFNSLAFLFVVNQVILRKDFLISSDSGNFSILQLRPNSHQDRQLLEGGGDKGVSSHVLLSSGGSTFSGPHHPELNLHHYWSQALQVAPSVKRTSRTPGEVPSFLYRMVVPFKRTTFSQE